MSHDWKDLPQVCDLVAVTIKQVDYYGYVDDIDVNWKHTTVKVEFFPGESQWFYLAEVRPVSCPRETP